MSSLRFVVLVIVVAAAGFVGGAFSGRLFPTPPLEKEPVRVLALQALRAENIVCQGLVTQDLVLKNEQGQEVARLHAPEGQPRFTLGLSRPEAEQTAPLVLGLNPQGDPGLGLADRQGQVRLLLTLSPEGAPQVRLVDEQGEHRAFFGLVRPEEAEEESTALVLNHGPASIALMVDKKDQRIAVQNRYENLIWSVP